METSEQLNFYELPDYKDKVALGTAYELLSRGRDKMERIDQLVDSPLPECPEDNSVIQKYNKHVGNPCVLTNFFEPGDRARRTLGAGGIEGSVLLRIEYKNGLKYLVRKIDESSTPYHVTYHPNSIEDEDEVMALFLGLQITKAYPESPNSTYGIVVFWNNRTYVSIGHYEEDLNKYIYFPTTEER